MTTPGRLHLLATLVLAVLVAGVTLAQAGVFQTPSGGWGADRPTTSIAPIGGTFQIDGASGSEN